LPTHHVFQFAHRLSGRYLISVVLIIIPKTPNAILLICLILFMHPQTLLEQVSLTQKELRALC